jgi:hypothetical protein
LRRAHHSASDECRNRHQRREDRLDDPPHRRVEAIRRVELTDRQLRMILRRAF